MGSRKFVGPNIEYIANNDSHGAQFSSEFRSLVKTEVSKFSAENELPGDNENSLSAENKPDPARVEGHCSSCEALY